MIIFLRKIPVNTKYQEISDFVAPALKGGLFKRSGRMVKAEILGLKDTRLNTVEFHALVTIEPDSVGFRAIKMLKGRRFKDKLIVIRQYFFRSWQNDPRQRYQTLSPGILEKRKADRRRSKDIEVIKDISDHFSSSGDFVRKGT
jgi:hypothetical protein